MLKIALVWPASSKREDELRLARGLQALAARTIRSGQSKHDKANITQRLDFSSSKAKKGERSGFGRRRRRPSSSAAGDVLDEADELRAVATILGAGPAEAQH